MTDRELLEDAAKAAGYDCRWEGDGDFTNLEDGLPWNPLIDDGDALRLAVKLNLLIDCNYCCAMALDLPDRDWWGGGEDERAGVAHGMTLRDYFAAKAMLGFLASDEASSAANMARAAYMMADAMLKAREA